ncbi:MAG: methanogenesis marker 17 protein [Methanophagales archaeon]|nr:methanogenesis marker 17 protein [Methanophagales archaeon]
MEVKVEGGDDFGNASYEKICADTFRDIGIRSSIDHVYMYCNPEEHVFIIAVKIGRVASAVKVREITRWEEDKEGVKDKLRITDEKYAPELLALLWDKYGERVQQISRLELLFKLEEKEAEKQEQEEEKQKLMELTVYDLRKDLIARILSGIDRILPEGARVRSTIPSTTGITIIASENPISENWKKKAEEMWER